LYKKNPKDSKFQNSEYEVHQVGPKDYVSRNFRFLAFKGTDLVSRQITATATQQRVTDGFYFIGQIIFILASYDKWEKYWFRDEKNDFFKADFHV
jgi:hypothetical protein